MKAVVPIPNLAKRAPQLLQLDSRLSVPKCLVSHVPGQILHRNLIHMKMVIVGVMSALSRFYDSVPCLYRTDIGGLKQSLKS
jgi:hypothetical protein